MTIKTWCLNFEGEYEIDYYGNVYSWKSGKPKYLKSTLHKNGYRTIELQSLDKTKRKKIYIHRLVWESFKKEELKKTDWIYHIDGDKTNNRITNLEKKSILKVRKKEEEGTFKVIEENGVEREFKNKSDIMAEYGISYININKGIKTGDYIEVYEKKNL